MIQILLIVALMALVSTALVCAWLSLPKRTRRSWTDRIRLSTACFISGVKEALTLPTRLWRRAARPRYAGQVQFANLASGVHNNGKTTKLADAALATRYLLVKKGTDSNHIAVAGAADTPSAVANDAAQAAEDEVNVQYLCCAGQTVRVQTDGSGALVADDILVPAAAGQVKKISAAGGNYYVVGRVVTAPQTVAGDEFEMAPIGAWLTQ